MRTPNLSKFYRPHTCPSCKVKFKAGQRHDKEMCALGASSPNGNNGYRERLALLLKDNEKEKEKQTDAGGMDRLSSQSQRTIV